MSVCGNAALEVEVLLNVPDSILEVQQKLQSLTKAEVKFKERKTPYLEGYKFDNLSPGAYSLSEGLLSGWTQISIPSSVVITAGQDSTNNNFINLIIISKKE